MRTKSGKNKFKGGHFMITNFKYHITPFGCIINEYNGTDKIVMIPEKIAGCEVREIGASAFAANKLIEKVVLPDGVEFIGSYAFAGCENLKTLILPETLCEISYSVFLDCKSLNKIRFNGSKESWEKVVNRSSFNNAKLTISESSKLSNFLDNCKDADEIRKE